MPLITMTQPIRPETPALPEGGSNPRITELAVMAALVIVYLLVALYNLGSFKVPTSAWQPLQQGEAVIVDLGRPVEVEKIYYHCGINDKKYDIPKFSLDYDKGGQFQPLTMLERGDCSSWKVSTTRVTTAKLRLVAGSPGGKINELMIVGKGSSDPISEVRIVDSRSTGPDPPANLLDEPHTFTATPSFLNGFYFDEIYHGRTAYEHLHRVEPYETTHPPLGKLFIASGIAVFGMNSFGWRIAGTLFGTALLPVLYLFARKLFGSPFLAFCAAFLMAVDFMHFTQSRIALIDIFGVFFITLMYYFMYDFCLNASPAAGWRRSARPLLLCGACFGLGAACKWIALYGGVGITLLLGLHLFGHYRLCLKQGGVQRFFWTYLLPVAGCGLLSFVLVPATIYLLSYVPFLAVPGEHHGIMDILRNQRDMFAYHSKLKATHPFSSPWWRWPLDLQPVWYYSGSGLPPGKVSTIAAFGNPLIWWTGIPAVVTAMILAARRRDWQMGIVFIGFACQYLPWILVTRLTFIYHFFSAVPFMILSQVYVMQRAMERWPAARYGAYAYLAAAGLLFVAFYPVLSGLTVSTAYVDRLKWLSTWIF